MGGESVSVVVLADSHWQDPHVASHCLGVGSFSAERLGSTRHHLLTRPGFDTSLAFCVIVEHINRTAAHRGIRLARS